MADHPAAATLQASMRPGEYECLRGILRDLRPSRTLEIGMATGGSTIEICRCVQEFEGARHVAIDPFQSSPTGWKGKGIERVKEAGFESIVEVIEDFDYLALPQLIRDGRRFDFILIDGWHSFDYTLVDFFFADLLLERGGVLAIHDTGWPAVYKVCRFIETHKPYELLSPAPAVELKSLAARLMRRAGQIIRGPAAMAEARDRRTKWFSLVAYRKKKDDQVGDSYFARF